MPTVVTQQSCVICMRNEPIMHSHHTIPCCRGGNDSLQVILCPNDHNTIHAQALHVVSQIRNPTKEKRKKKFWRTVEHEKRALPLVQLIVIAFLEENTQGVHTLKVSLPTPEFREFKLLAKDLNRSQEQTVLFCIQFTLKNRGIKNESSLWFMPKSRKR